MVFDFDLIFHILPRLGGQSEAWNYELVIPIPKTGEKEKWLGSSGKACSVRVVLKPGGAGHRSLQISRVKPEKGQTVSFGSLWM